MSDQTVTWCFAGRTSRDLAHAVTDGAALCGVHVTKGWDKAYEITPRCHKCVVAASDDLITYRDLLRTGITYRQLDYWVRRGYLQCSVPATGSGSLRLFSAPEVEVAATMARLVEAGVTPASAANAARTGFLAPGIRVNFVDHPSEEAA